MVKYTYLRKNNILIGVMVTEAGAWDIRTRGICTSQALSPAQAAEFF